MTGPAGLSITDLFVAYFALGGTAGLSQLAGITIGQAKGILMERLRITPDEAFDLLRRSSQRLNVKLREIAQKLTDTGELDGPDRP